MNTTTTQFVPPSARQIREHLDRYAVTGPSRLMMWLPTAGLAAVIVLSFTGQGAGLFLAWLLLLGIVVFTSIRAGRTRSIEQRAVRVQELALLRHYPQALRLAWRLLPAVTVNGEVHGRLVALMGHALEQVGAYEQAIVVYDWLIERLPQGHPASLQLQAQRAIAQIAAQRLADADRSLRSRRGVADGSPPGPLSAAYRLAILYQLVHTGHDEDALAVGGNLVDELRPLGVEAGLGYALMATAEQRMIQRRPEEADHYQSEARTWWTRATLLMPARVLRARFPEIPAELEGLAASLAPSNPVARERGPQPHD